MGDEHEGRWRVASDADVEELIGRLDEGAVLTRHVLATTPLDRASSPGGRFDDDLPSLTWICFHVLQEYARHLGHLDVAVELAGGSTGEAP